MSARRHIATSERRARLVSRHHLGRTAADVEAAVRALVAVHSSDPTTPYLALWARVAGFTVDDLERALYRDRSLWRLHAMRRTLFLVPTERGQVVQAACGQNLARAERRKLEGWVAQALNLDQPGPWLRAVEQQTLAALADGRPRRTGELTAMVEGLALRIRLGSGKWASDTPLSSRLLFLAAMEGRITRAQPAGSWLSSQYHWADAAVWFDGLVTDPAGTGQDPSAARADLARWWLHAHGPATATDLRWWAGWSARTTAAALHEIGAVEVGLDGAAPGLVLPDDIEPPIEDPSGVALLPALDPSVMGWKDRDWYLGHHARQLFDRNGNAGPTVWVDGRVVGGWGQRPDGEVVTRLLDDVGRQAARLVDEQAAALTAWSAGTRYSPRFPSPLGSELSASTTAR